MDKQDKEAEQTPEQEEKGLDFDDEDQPSLTLISKDGQSFSLSTSTACQSEYIKGMVELDSTVTRIELKHINGNTIAKIIEWMEYHVNTPSRPIPRPIKTASLKDTVGVWDADYVDCTLEVVFEVLLAANFLNIGPLLELCSAKVASLMLGKTPKQIRKTFDIREDFTAEEEQDIRKEFSEFL